MAVGRERQKKKSGKLNSILSTITVEGTLPVEVQKEVRGSNKRRD